MMREKRRGLWLFAVLAVAACGAQSHEEEGGGSEPANSACDGSACAPSEVSDASVDNEAPPPTRPEPDASASDPVPNALERVITIEGEPYGSFGGGNAIVGDLDADGYDDFVVMDGGGSGTMADQYGGVRGAVYLFYGRPELDPSFSALDADAILRGGSGFVTGLGDVDGDGFPDFAFSSGAGVHVVFGGVERLSGEMFARDIGALFTFGESVEADALRFTFYVASAGDLNGDGHVDLFVQARDDDDSKDPIDSFLIDGAAIARSGSIDLAAGAALELGRGLHLGGAGAGDVDGDGFDDLLWLIQEELSYPRAELIYGRSTLLEGPPTAEDVAATWEGVFWATLGSAGDLDGDGFGDFAVNSQNSVAIVHGSPDRLSGLQRRSDSDFIIRSEGEPTYLAGLGFGDIDGDGWWDVLIGDPHHDHNGPQSGALYVVRGASRLEGSRRLGPDDVVRYGGAVPSEEGVLREDLGYGTASGGDVNGDGFDDVLVGAGGDVIGDDYGGATYLLLGGR